MRIVVCFIFLNTFISTGFTQQKKANAYFPTKTDWQKRAPEKWGWDMTQLHKAIRFAIEKESKAPRNLETSALHDVWQRTVWGCHWSICRAGRHQQESSYIKVTLLLEWGEPQQRVDMTFSVTKSFLSTVVGLAVDKGLIQSVNDPVWKYVPPIEVYQPAPDNRRCRRFRKTGIIDALCIGP